MMISTLKKISKRCFLLSKTCSTTGNPVALLCCYVPQCQFGSYRLTKFKIPPKYDDVEYPERRKLRMLERVPQLPPNKRPPKMFKRLIDMRGPEEVHNKIQYGEYAIQALSGGQMRWGHIEGMRLVVNRKMDERRMFAVWRIDGPWKPITKKGLGHRMGKGKGSIDHYTFPLKAGRIILEMGGQCELPEVKTILTHITKITPFKSRVVTREILEKEEEERKYIEENNINPFTFEHCAKHNMLGARMYLSPYYVMWKGKYR